MKLFFVEMKVFERREPFRVVPGVAEENSSYVPEDGTNFRQGSNPPLPSFNRTVL
jgi:hypothetical protein